jgi:hypothetical protein
LFHELISRHKNLDSTLRLLFSHHHIDEEGEDIIGIKAKLKLDKAFEDRISNERITSILDKMMESQLIQRSPLNPSLFMIAPFRRQWTNLKIKCMDGSFIKNGQQKDLGSQLTSIFGNPKDNQCIKNASFFITAACSVIALTQHNKEVANSFTAYDFFVHIMQRFSDYKSALASEQFRKKLEALPINDLVHEEQATSSFWLQFVSDVATSPDNLEVIDPASISCFLFPSNFKQFNWMYIQMKDNVSQQDDEVFGAIEKVFFIKSSDKDAKTIFIRANHTKDLPASFCQLNFPTTKIDSTIFTILSTTKKENKFVISSKLPQGFPNISGLTIPKTIVFDSNIDPRAKLVLKHSQLEADLKKWLHARDYTEGLTKAQIEEAFCRAHSDCQAFQIQSCIQQLIDCGFLYQSNSVDSEFFLVSPHSRIWKDMRLHINGQSFHTQFKDLGIWLDKATGYDGTPLPYKCFALHIAHAYVALTKTPVLASHLDDYMQFRFQQFKIALDQLHESKHWVVFENHHQHCMETCDNITDPAFVSNSTFWSHPDILSELAVSYGKGTNTSMWAFMLLPIEFHKFNYLIVNVSAYHDPSDTIKATQLSGPSHYFISSEENARTIVLAYQGGHDGHFFLLRLHASKEEQMIQLATQAQSSIRLQLRKDERQFWAPISAACQDSSILSFIDHRPDNLSFNFDAEAPAQNQSAEETMVAADELSPNQKAKRTRLRKAMDKTAAELSALFDQADELCLIVPEELPIGKLNKYIEELTDIISNGQTLTAKAISIESQMSPEQKEQLVHLTKPQQRLPAIIEMKNKFVRTKETKSGKKAPKKSASAKKSEETTEKTALDFMFKVKSVFPSEDVSDQMSDSSLLSLFIVIPVPHSTVTLYHSILEASCNLSIISEMEVIFKRQLKASKELACEIHQVTRSQFSQFQDCPMVRGGRTFNEYLTYKGAQSWGEIANDHILGEISLCSQVWKLNIAVIWRHEGVWRLFISVNGGSSPILSLLYAKMKYVISTDGFPQFCASTASRFFPLLPTKDDWFLNEAFIASIPNSVPEDEPQEIISFNRRVDKESLFASIVQTEGTVSSDTSSIVTADYASELLMDSFLDNESVSQGSLPTPPEIKAIPLKKQCETVNVIASVPLHQITAIRRKRVIYSDSSSSPPAGRQPPRPTGAGADDASHHA